MTPEIVLDVFRHTLEILVVLVSLILMPALVVGLLVAMFQAATSINEMTLSFIPKLLVTLGTLMMAGPYMMKIMLSYFERVFHDIPYLLG
ncbi:MAG: flagellar biosynthesis protein FliQ [Gammaproteobacteria bacterium]|nr:flagellar biosynthesis protein FliQ [Gammaproteobacteria bacterium]MDH5729982.1 flagellar biosynthesis protein FliQ [Gammaproteobacteria bacterium]